MNHLVTPWGGERSRKLTLELFNSDSLAKDCDGCGLIERPGLVTEAARVEDEHMKESSLCGKIPPGNTRVALQWEAV